MKKVSHLTHYVIDEELAADLREALKYIMLINPVWRQVRILPP
jgi:hypothetical protein